MQRFSTILFSQGQLGIAPGRKPALRCGTDGGMAIANYFMIIEIFVCVFRFAGLEMGGR